MNWQRWIRPGLVLTFLLAAVALGIRGGSVEEDLRTRVVSALTTQGQGWAEISAAWRTVVINGIAPSERAQLVATELAAAVEGVNGVSDRSRLLPEQSPYVWSARKVGELVTIEGSVPSEGARQSLLAEARRVFPSNEIREELDAARGAPEVYANATGFALGRLAGLEDGVVTLTDATLVVSGTALNAVALVEARRAFESEVPIGVNMGPIEVLPTRANRFVWSASATAGSVVVAGFVPNEAVRDIVVAEIREAFPGSAIEDSSVVASGEPEGFLDAVSFAVEVMVRLENGGVTLDGLMLDIAGTAKSVDDYEALLKGVEDDLPAGLTVLAADVVPALVSDYGWRGAVSPDGVELVGFVGTLQERADLDLLVEEVFGDRPVNNAVRIASGGPRIDWIGAVKFAVGELGLLKEGTVSISADAAYQIDGEALSSPDYAAISEAVEATLPASMSLASNTVRPPARVPYRFGVERNGGKIAISGYVSDRLRHQAVLASVQRSFGGYGVEDHTEFASDVPQGFWEAADSGLRALSRMSGGEFTLADTSLDLNGAVHFEAAKSRIEDVLWERLPDEFSAASNVTVRQTSLPLSAMDCGSKLTEVLSKSRLEFLEGGDNLAGYSHGPLDLIAATLTRCPETVIEIGVHSDSDGSKSANRRRTLARAETILELLVEAEVPRERLTAVGYGESTPLASNSTSEGKAANRRIEFSMAVPEPPPQTEPPPDPDPGSEPAPAEEEAAGTNANETDGVTAPAESEPDRSAEPDNASGDTPPDDPVQTE